jgi:hypothetical protein
LLARVVLEHARDYREEAEIALEVVERIETSGTLDERL